MIFHLRYAYIEDISQLASEAERIGKECLVNDIKRFKAKQANGTN
jgi:hypothetical protein